MFIILFVLWSRPNNDVALDHDYVIAADHWNDCDEYPVDDRDLSHVHAPFDVLHVPLFAVCVPQSAFDGMPPSPRSITTYSC